jgi:hypothetical protein
MGLKWPQAGPNHVPSYQASGIPYVTSSVSGEVPQAANTKAPVNINFPYVTKFVTVNNTGTNDLRVAFTFSGSYAPGEVTTENLTLPAGHKRNYFIIKEQEAGSMQTVTFDVRCKSIFFLADNTGTTDFSLLAGLTTIPIKNFPTLTGSLNGTGSFKGVG